MERVEQKMDQHVYEEYIAILKEELVPALGCTEPIAIAYAAAKAREILGKLPEEDVYKRQCVDGAKEGRES